MSKLVDRLRSSLTAGKLEQALDAAITAWRDRRGIALAEAVDAIDATDPDAAFEGSHDAWLTAARKAKTNRDRGALLRAITKRTSGELVPAMKVALTWDDPRLSTQIIALLNALPFSGTRTRDVWRGVFEIAAEQHDPRFLALARSLPGTWNVGANTKKYLTNRLATANAGVAEVELAPDDEAALRSFVAELAKNRPAPPANEDALFAAIYANPDDDAPRLVYSDWLQERGDPRGEFIALQLQPMRDAASEKRMRALLKASKKAWLGPLAPVLGGDIEFRRGFVAKATVKFRHQRDAEQHGSHPAWATVEELDWGNLIVRDDQEEWAHYIDPAMCSLREVDGAHPRFLLAATRPWRLERLTLGYRVDSEQVRAILESPMLPHLQRVTLPMSRLAPESIDKLTRCPPHVVLSGVLEHPELARWLANAAKTAMQKLTINYWLADFDFTRDSSNAFTRLDAVIHRDDDTFSTKPYPAWVKDMAKAVSKLPDNVVVTHFDANVIINGQRLPVPPITEAGQRHIRSQ